MKNFNKLLTLIILCFTVTLFAGPIIPAKTHAKLFLSIIKYDKNIKSRCKDGLKIAFAYKAENDFINQFKTKLNKKNGKKIKGLKTTIKPIQFTDLNDLKTKLSAEKINNLYIDDVDESIIKELSSYTREMKILTFSKNPMFVNENMSTGVDYINNKPQIVLNLAQSGQEGSEFSFNLIKYSKILKK